MLETLGILAATDRNLKHLTGITRAAARQGKKVIIFFTGAGVLLTRQPGFEALAGLAEMSICKVSFEAHGLDPSRPIPGLPPESFVSQSRHRDLLDRCGRYISL